MTRRQQKQEERRFVEQLLKLRGIPDVRELEPADPAPDFLLTRQDGRRVAIEVTQLFHPIVDQASPRQALENYRSQILARAAEEWMGRHLPHVEILVHFNTHVPINKADVPHLAQSLCDLVERSLPAPDSHARLDFEWEQREDFPEAFISIRIVRLNSYHQSYWNGCDAGYLPTLRRHLVIEALQQKGSFDYHLRGTENWLLLVIDTHRISSSFDLSKDILEVPFEAPFDRVFILETFSSSVYELELRPPSTGDAV